MKSCRKHAAAAEEKFVPCQMLPRVESSTAPAAGTIKVLVTLGQLVSTYAPTTLVQLTPDAK